MNTRRTRVLAPALIPGMLSLISSAPPPVAAAVGLEPVKITLKTVSTPSGDEQVAVVTCTSKAIAGGTADAPRDLRCVFGNGKPRDSTGPASRFEVIEYKAEDASGNDVAMLLPSLVTGFAHCHLAPNAAAAAELETLNAQIAALKAGDADTAQIEKERDALTKAPVVRFSIESMAYAKNGAEAPVEKDAIEAQPAIAVPWWPIAVVHFIDAGAIGTTVVVQAAPGADPDEMDVRIFLVDGDFGLVVQWEESGNTKTQTLSTGDHIKFKVSQQLPTQVPENEAGADLDKFLDEVEAITNLAIP